MPFLVVNSDEDSVLPILLGGNNEEDRDYVREKLVIDKGDAVITKYIQHSVPFHKDNYFKAYMDYRCITDTSSKQWAMQLGAYTDENGMRKIGDYYCIALGSGFSSALGSKFKITLDTGVEFLGILADQKANIHTDSSNRFIDVGSRLNIVEFIVQDDMLPSIVKTMGDVNYTPGDIFKGNIIRIEEIE
ncbi:hypothetical protein M2140_000040 [Clostridiales Family XIII bacterium PM5-7]